MSTLGISDQSFIQHIKNVLQIQLVFHRRTTGESATIEGKQTRLNEVRVHIEAFPRMESHYCRKQ